MNERQKTIFLWIIISMILFAVLNNFGEYNGPVQRYSYSEFVRSVEQGQVSRVTIADQVINGETKGGQRFTTFMPVNDPALLKTLLEKDVVVVGRAPDQNIWLHILISWFPTLLFIGFLLWWMRQMQGGGSSSGRGGPLSFGRSKARLLTGDKNRVTFDDVAGIVEAKKEVEEFVDFLKDPKKFSKLGGKIPCGALLVGPPGTGKTLLAKAVAGEANVPFFSISGSDFVEMFVGVGASRVRDMFDQAKKQAPCIIFIDEIDAVGRHRGAGLGGGHDEREQTLNQLLVEMDGFEGKEGVIVLAATNRPDVLDPALLRPGRFDRQVVVSLPDILGREEILHVHMSNVTTDKSVDAEVIARATPGFSGADLANLVNEAALFAARRNKKKVTMDEFEAAKDKLTLGAERHMVMTDEDKKLTAYHEAGHAIVGLLVGNHDKVYKVTIIPRGMALGVTYFLPEKDKFSMSRAQIESMISSLYGGRIAEELIFGADMVTTGASNDIEKASELARNLVERWGLNDKMGPINYSSGEQEVFLGKSMSNKRDIADSTCKEIDHEVRNLIEKNYKRAEKILKDNIKILHLMADALMKFETLNESQIATVMQGKMPRNAPTKSKRGQGKPPVSKNTISKENLESS
ncbi:MAG: ATP-dependent metalloprotease [Legionellales bacterium]|nr:ATP-dependent metalloprotease [Legionellales bacterium]OUX67778.1 MAG: ATP-dependent metalloprotease [bacterium TMED178]